MLIDQKLQPDAEIQQETIKNKKKFAEETGISIQNLERLQIGPNRSETRKNKGHSLQTDTQPIDHLQTAQKIDKQHHTIPSQSKNIHKPIKETRILSSQKILKKQHFAIPKCVDQFFQNYIMFSGVIFPPSSEDRNFIETKKQQLFNLLITSIEHGGIVSIVSQGLKKQVLNSFVSSFCVSSAQQVFRIYKRFLFHFEYDLLENYNFRQYHDPTLLFEEATFVEEQQLEEFLKKSPLNPHYFQYDILVFKNGEKVLKVDRQLISLDRVTEHYKDYEIDIRIQKALDYGFKPRNMRNQPYKMKIGDYRKYQKLCHQYRINNLNIDQAFIQNLGKVKDLDVNGVLFKERLKNDEIFFGVNFDPEDGILFDHISEKTDGTFIGFKQQFDLLSYLDHEVPGCSFPQFYFKVKGVWTGGHQENLNMCAVNINHGPDSSEWYTMEFKYVEQFRAQLKKQFKMDLYAGEGLWYEKINWFVEQGKYPIKKIIQKKGDIVISGPGTLHWVRSHGIALQSAWNQFPITFDGLKYAFHRQQQNQNIHFIRSNVIPLKKLILKLLNHQRPELTPSIKKLCVQKVKDWLKQEQQSFQQLLEDQSYDFCQDTPKYEKLDDLQGFCLKCRQEIMVYFVNGKMVQDIMCLSCYKKEYKGKKKTKRLYMRHSLYQIEQLIRLNEQGRPFAQIQSFCSPFIGKVPIKCPKNRYKVDKQEIFVQKVNLMNQQLNKCSLEKLKIVTQRLKQKRQAQKQEDQHKIQKCIKQQKMEIQHIETSSKQPTKKSSLSNEDFRMKNGVKYLGRYPRESGWWKFEVPDHLKVVTQQNHVELLKLIEQQEYFVKNQARKHQKSPPFYPYKVFRSNMSHEKLHQYEHIKVDEPNFSSDSQIGENEIRKKVKKNEDQEKQLDVRSNNHAKLKKQRQQSESRSNSQSQKKKHKNQIKEEYKKENKRSPSYHNRQNSHQKNQRGIYSKYKEERKEETRKQFMDHSRQRYQKTSDYRQGWQQDYKNNDNYKTREKRQDYHDGYVHQRRGDYKRDRQRHEYKKYANQKQFNHYTDKHADKNRQKYGYDESKYRSNYHDGSNRDRYDRDKGSNKNYKNPRETRYEERSQANDFQEIKETKEGNIEIDY